jgi:ectoine hydroxylase-related dioxygenase (phytanoyl-CoA dioxygenase family)
MRHLKEYRERGFAIVRGVFGSDDVAALSDAFDAVQSSAAVHQGTFRHGNVLYAYDRDPRLGPVLRFVQWASYFNRVVARYRVDPRIFGLIEPLIGRDVKHLINSMIWKQPGSAGSFAYHQDARFRRPAIAYRNLATSMVQMAIAVDPQHPENGCMRMVAGTHRGGDLRLGITHGVYTSPCTDSDLEAVGLDLAEVVDIVLKPGDVVLWHPYTVHGSRPNTSTSERRAYLNGYGAARDCDRGPWAFRDGVACDIGDPVLIQYDDLFERPEPHYVEGPPHPVRPE